MRILVADDEFAQHDSAPGKLVSRLGQIGHEARGVSTSREAKDLVRQERWDVAIIDLRWQTEGDTEGRVGWELVKTIRSMERNADAQVIIYSGYLDPEIEKRAIEERVIAVPKMRPGGPPPLESEHLSSLLTTVRALGWLMEESGRRVFSRETYEKLRDPLERFFRDEERGCSDYEKNVFLMTRFQKGNKTLELIDRTIRKALGDRGLAGHRADDRCYTADRNLWDNVCTYMFGCKYGIAVLEDILRDEFNPNVALEYGFLRALGRPTLLLKEQRFTPRADILGTLWEEFDILDVEKTIAEAIHRWLDDLGIPKGQPPGKVIYDWRRRNALLDFRGEEGYIWEGKGEKAKRISPPGQGTLEIQPGGLLVIRRTNTEGRYEIHLLRYGPEGEEKGSFAGASDPNTRRAFQITCAAKAVGGAHTLRFVLRHKETWLSSREVWITASEWTPVKLLFQVQSDLDGVLRIDDLKVEKAPSELHLRDLRFIEV